MYDIKWIRDNARVFDKGRKRRGLEPLADTLLALDDKRRVAIAKSQAAQERRNAASKEIGAAMKAGDASLAKALKIEVGDLKTALPEYEAEEREAIAALDKALAEIPNTPLDEVPDGRDENDNVELRRVGEPPHVSFEVKEHFDIGEALGLMDFETAMKISGARFVVNKGALARLERALGAFMLDLHTGEKHGYTEVNPPILVRDEAMFGTAQLPKFREDQFGATNEIEIEKWLKDPDNSRISELQKRHSEILKRRAAFEKIPDELNQPEDQLLLNYVSDLWREFAKARTRLWLIPTAEVPSPISSAKKSSTKMNFPSASPPARRVFAPRRARPEKTHAA